MSCVPSKRRVSNTIFDRLLSIVTNACWLSELQMELALMLIVGRFFQIQFGAAAYWTAATWFRERMPARTFITHQKLSFTQILISIYCLASACVAWFSTNPLFVNFLAAAVVLTARWCLYDGVFNGTGFKFSSNNSRFPNALMPAFTADSLSRTVGGGSNHGVGDSSEKKKQTDVLINWVVRFVFTYHLLANRFRSSNSGNPTHQGVYRLFHYRPLTQCCRLLKWHSMYTKRRASSELVKPHWNSQIVRLISRECVKNSGTHTNVEQIHHCNRSESLLFCWK